MGNPVLFIHNAGFGETPVPADALMQPGDPLAGRNTYGGTYEARCVAVVPVGVPLEYAMADQATPKQPRPLMLRKRKQHKETLYLIQRADDLEPSIFTHSQIAEGLRLAREAEAQAHSLQKAERT